MGVPGLWSVLNPIKRKTYLTKFVTQTVLKKWKKHLHEEDVRYVIGVDLYIFLVQLQHSLSVGHAQSGYCPEVQALFYRLTHYSKLSASFIFVVDGDKRPDVKRGKKVTKAPVWLVEAAEKFIKAFGFGWHQAPGEAEAELAKMNDIGVVDAVLTNDGDAFVFGARTIILNPTLDHTRDPTSILTYSDVAKDADAHVLCDHGGCILFALLCGSDYDMKGVEGCGSATALSIARYGLGGSLVNNFADLGPNSVGFQRFLIQWRQALAHALRVDPEKYQKNRNTKAADWIENHPEFPDINIISLLLFPVVSSIVELRHRWREGPQALTQFTTSTIKVHEIKNLCESYLHWIPDILADRFHRFVWPGIIMRCVIDDIIDYRERQVASVDISTREYAATTEFLSDVTNICDLDHAKISIDIFGYTELIPSDLRVICGRSYAKPPNDGSNRLHRVIPTTKLTVALPKAILECASQRWLNELSQGKPLLNLMGIEIPEGFRVKEKVPRDSDSPTSWDIPPASDSESEQDERDVIDLTGEESGSDRDGGGERVVIDLTGDDSGDDGGMDVLRSIQNTAPGTAGSARAASGVYFIDLT